MTKFYLKTEYIELCKLLKITSMVLSGAEAKDVISQELVFVNEKIETRKRYKAIQGDVIRYNERIITICAED